MSECERLDNGVALSSMSSRQTSTESLEENIRKILTSCEDDDNEFLDRRRSTSSPEDVSNRKGKGSPKEVENGKKSSDKGKENWEMDSGTHDLENIEQLVNQAANSKGSSRSSNFLELANTLHLAALASLKSEIVELSRKLQSVTEERDSLQTAVDQTAAERQELIRDYEDRLQTQQQQSEEQITELQSVIAELNKKHDQNDANKIDELDEIESQTSEHGSRSSESLESLASNSDELDEELSKVVGGLEFAIERQSPESKEHSHGKEPIKVTDGDKEQETGEEGAEPTPGESSPGAGTAPNALPNADSSKKLAEFNELSEKCRIMRVHCLELEKKKQILEKRVQQASLREYVARKKSSSSDPATEATNACSDCEVLRERLKTSMKELEQARAENGSFKEERDRLRQRILEMQEHLKALHQKTIQYETTRQRASSLHEHSPQGGRSPRLPRSNPPSTSVTQGWADPRGRPMPRQSGYNSAASDVSSRDGHMSPRMARRSSAENVNAVPSRSPSTPRRSVTLPAGHYGRRSSAGSNSAPWSDASTPRNPATSSTQSIASQVFWRGMQGTSDLGSSHGSSQEITVMARPVEAECPDARSSGEQCIRTLSQLPEFTNGKLPSELIRALRTCRNLGDVYKVLFSYCDEQADRKLKEYELEMERLRSKVDHLQAQNNVISLSLEESRENADKMCILMGKYESNNTALQLALSYCDNVIEVMDVLRQLAESEQACLYANCRAAGVKTGFLSYAESSNPSYRLTYEDETREGNDGSIESCLARRREAETEAKVLLQKLDRNETHTSRDQPWESVSSHSRTSSGSSNDMEFTKEEETRLKSYIQQLRSERSTIGSTVLELESIHGMDKPDEVNMHPIDPKLDLENAVLMQELMALKEERAELKAKNYLVEKEKKALELKINSREAQEQAYLVQIEHLKSEVKDELKKRRKLERETKDGNLSGNLSGSNSGSGTLSDLRTSDEDMPADLQEAARRERKLRARIKELMEALESLSKNSENRHTQTAEYVCDLKRANGALVAAYEKAKKKHGARLRKLEQQMMTMVERHDAQVRTLKERISLLEDELSSRQNETAL
ncbi:colorectal mutant cancer protein isoform X2 [Nematostella vectensis]|uniref:colorectal mutant cancer protein isoform X2 n=1 Tax=Nematostella vectensis TaxID=45351 RepID=UPI00138FBE26|nr:colorectal mutant cancer protein isoform X2 [Nematostella vectensis]